MMTTETKSRVHRTILQSLAASTFTGILIAYVSEDAKALLVALATAVMTVVATWAQNKLEDLERIRDRRPARS